VGEPRRKASQLSRASWGILIVLKLLGIRCGPKGWGLFPSFFLSRYG
jgi:hypothetical protein